MQTVLIVEDDIYLQKGLKEILNKEGFKVIACSDGSEACKKINTDISLVILDIMLPDDEGISICKNIRENYDIPIIFLTARDNEIDIVRGLDAGGDDYITKPFRIREVLSRIRANLRRYEKGKADSLSLSFADITLNPVRRTARIADSDLLLTPIEFQLLQCLIQSKNQGLTRNQLLESIWDAGGAFIENNTLSVHIYRLREKLAISKSITNVKTVRGVGYQIEAMEDNQGD